MENKKFYVYVWFIVSMCLETGESFKCIKDAMEKYGVKYAASFTAAINKPTRTAAKLHWITI